MDFILLKAGSAGAVNKKSQPLKPAPVAKKLSSGYLNLLVVLVLIAGFHAFFHMVNGSINGFNGSHAMSAFIVLGFFQMVFGLLQGFKRSLHVRLIVVIIACDGSDGNAKEAQNDC
jgi:hypothetical protein